MISVVDNDIFVLTSDSHFIILASVESYHDYDRLEYSGIILIAVTMTALGMDAALIAGFIAAISTFAVQSITYQHPIKGAIEGTTLRSSAWNRSSEAQTILLDNKKGRKRIYVIQLQGHIFFFA